MGQLWHTGVDRGGASEIFQADPEKTTRNNWAFFNKGIDDGQSQVDLNHYKSLGGSWWTFTPNYPWLSYSFIKAKTTNQRCVPARARRSLPDSYSAGQWSWNLARWRRRCDRSLALGVPQICHRFAFLA